MKIIKKIIKNLKELPALLWIRIGIFLFGSMLSLILGGHFVLVLVSFLLGVIITRIDTFKPAINTYFLFHAGLLVLGLMVFAKNTSRVLILALFVIGLYLGLELKKRF